MVIMRLCTSKAISPQTRYSPVFQCKTIACSDTCSATLEILALGRIHPFWFSFEKFESKNSTSTRTFLNAVAASAALRSILKGRPMLPAVLWFLP